MTKATNTDAGEQRIYVSLAELKIDSANTRKTNTKPAASFVASIAADGVEQPLLVRAEPARAAAHAGQACWLVYAGGLRMRALQMLRDAGKESAGVIVTDDFPVPVIVRNVDDVRARRISLIENLHRADMHPVDRYEAVAAALADGETEQSIATRHGMTVAAVKQALALGATASCVRAAWRDGLIDARTAQAFTLGDEADQVRVFNRLHKAKRLFENDVLEALKVDDGEVGAMASFVGAEAYVAAGGKISTDLFTPGRAVVSDPVKLKELADVKLAQACEDLIAKGWKFAVVKPPNYYDHTRDRLEPKFTSEEKLRIENIERELEQMERGNDWDSEKQDQLEAEKADIEQLAIDRAAAPKYRAAHGCMVTISAQGTLRVEPGYKNPPSQKRVADAGATSETVAKAAAAARNTAPKKTSLEALSKALNMRLSEQLTRAAAEVMRQSPAVATAALIAGALADSIYGKRVDVTVGGLARRNPKSTSQSRGQVVSFFKLFESTLALDATKAALEVAGLAARALDFQEHNGESPMKRKETAAVVNALEPKAILAAVAKAWDPKDYFAGISGKQRALAVAEALGDEQARAMSKSGAKDMQIKWCVTNVPPTGWLPPQLRPAHYNGPAPRKTEKPAAAKGGRRGVARKGQGKGRKSRGKNKMLKARD